MHHPGEMVPSGDNDPDRAGRYGTATYKQRTHRRGGGYDTPNAGIRPSLRIAVSRAELAGLRPRRVAAAPFVRSVPAAGGWQLTVVNAGW